MSEDSPRVLITGGAGLIGSHIADQLIKGEAGMDCREIVVLDNFDRGTRSNTAWAVANGPVTVIEGDIRNRALVTETMQGIDLVYHQAAIRITQCAQEPRLAMEVMAEGTFNVLDAAQAAGVKKVVAASSASVYGMAEAFPTSERHHPYNNRTIYGALKVFNEGLLRSFNEMYGLDYVALRYFNVYGCRMDIYGVYTEVFVRWMERIEAGQAPLIFGDGSQTIDLINAEEVARANLLAMTADVTDDVFNIASGEETTLKNLASLLAQAMGSDIAPECVEERKVNPVPRRLADVTPAAEKLGFRNNINVEDGLRNLVDWWRGERTAA